MCGNLGLLLTLNRQGAVDVELVVHDGNNADVPGSSSGAVDSADPILSPEAILRAMVAATEVRGGQAGGLSSFEYSSDEHAGPAMKRVRAVARKRYPLADDLALMFRRQCPHGDGKSAKSLSVIGHTRFATGSVNTLPELHPHDWFESGYTFETSQQDRCVGSTLNDVYRWDALSEALVPVGDSTKTSEKVFRWDADAGTLVPVLQPCVIHLTHNGDFDACDAYGGIALNGELGLWLERALHAPNSTTGDSPKLAGLLEVLRVQGRWGPAARLAWIRAVCQKLTDVSAGEALRKDAPYGAPSDAIWHRRWAPVFEAAWRRHARSVIRPLDTDRSRYTVSLAGVRAMAADVLARLADPATRGLVHQGAGQWSRPQLRAFVHHTIRGFLRNDLYSALTEALHRVHGTFGVQAHCSLEPGVVVIGSKGQPMQVAFAHDQPLVLFGSEAAAVQAAVTAGGRPLPYAIHLDELGEVMRMGPPAALYAGSYTNFVNVRENANALLTLTKLISGGYAAGGAGAEGAMAGGNGRPPATAAGAAAGAASGGAESLLTAYCLTVGGGVQLCAYSLVRCTEMSREQLSARAVRVEEPTAPRNPRADLVAKDLRETPMAMRAVEDAWSPSSHGQDEAGGGGGAMVTANVPSLSAPGTPNVRAAEAMSAHLLKLMLERRVRRLETVDLLIAGVEVSLWLAEQFASDLRSIFPFLNVRCDSANKLLGLGGFSPRKTFFAGTDSTTADQVRKSAILLVSHSGQTFPTLHATRLLERIAPGRVWLLTGVKGSQMEQALASSYAARGLAAPNDRVFWTCAGTRPAEPASLAVAAMHHTFTHLLLHLATHVRVNAPAAAIVQPWEGREGEGYSLDRLLARLPSASRGSAGADAPEPLTRLGDGCLADMRMMLAMTVPDVEEIVGARADGAPAETETHTSLVAQGRQWAVHVSEPWTVACLAGAYILVSVTLGAPVSWLVAHAALYAAGEAQSVDLGWTLARPLDTPTQDTGWTLLGFAVRLVDALVYIYCGKLLTWALRAGAGRPLWARHGKRTLVIVDTPTNHQMLEAFASKLFAQAYSFASIDVHGGAGVDHFVHRFTHRVARGLLLAVGRPDGRLCCLAKTEASLLLACKQAVFIQNPHYSQSPNSGNAPEIFTVGHNPLKPGYAVHHVPLPTTHRRKFVDELVYDRMVAQAARHTAKAILREVSYQMMRKEVQGSARSLARGYSFKINPESALYEEWRQIPFGGQYVPKATEKSGGLKDTPADLLTRRRIAIATEGAAAADANDPLKRLAFSEKLDAKTNEVQDRQIHIQRFYECRVAALERYMAFCVTFHAMAAWSCRPWFCRGWDVARSQSNLRVATTAAPISASDAENDEATVPVEVWLHVRRVGDEIRGFVSHF